MFSVLDVLLGLAGIAVPAAIALACWLLVAVNPRRREPAPAAVRPAVQRPLVHAGNGHPGAPEPVLESR